MNQDVADVTVVVVNCNGGADLGDCLDSLIASDPPPNEVVLVDNGSSDDSLTVARRRSEHFGGLKVIPLAENLGANAARNVGVENAMCEIVAFVDNDTRVKGDWIGRATQVMRDLGVDAVQCKLLLDHNHGLIDSLGYLMGPFAFPRHIVRPGAPDTEAAEAPRYLFGAKSAGMMVRRDLLLKIGGFDPSFFLYGDETDLFWRVFRAGGAVALAPQSIVFHASGGTKRFLAASAEDLLYRGGTRNYIRMVAKNQHPKRVLLDVIGQVGVWSGVATYQAASGHRQRARLITKGISEALRELPSLQRARGKDTLPFRVVPKSLKARLDFAYLKEVRRAI
jgi:GT2 family glycosyltransferase